jgi:hypothetical protein
VGRQDSYLLDLLSRPVGDCVTIMPRISLQRVQTWHENITVRQANEINLLHEKNTLLSALQKPFENTKQQLSNSIRSLSRFDCALYEAVPGLPVLFHNNTEDFTTRFNKTINQVVK